MQELTDNEKSIIKFLREARPFEKVVVMKDPQGKYDNYIITREQKVILTAVVLK